MTTEHNLIAITHEKQYQLAVAKGAGMLPCTALFLTMYYYYGLITICGDFWSMLQDKCMSVLLAKPS